MTKKTMCEDGSGRRRAWLPTRWPGVPRPISDVACPRHAAIQTHGPLIVHCHDATVPLCVENRPAVQGPATPADTVWPQPARPHRFPLDTPPAVGWSVWHGVPRLGICPTMLRVPRATIAPPHLRPPHGSRRWSVRTPCVRCERPLARHGPPLAPRPVELAAGGWWFVTRWHAACVARARLQPVRHAIVNP